MKADLLKDLWTAVTKGIQDGTTLEQFRKEFPAIVTSHGWTGWTGEGTPEGIAWRTQVIYETNLYTSYAAGRYQQMKEVAKDRPFWRYRHNDNVKTPRPLHVSWDGLIMAHDDPWWDTHYPPGGYGCKCYVETLAPRDLKKLGKTGPDQAPNNGTYNWINPDGSVREAGIPNGIDRGWNYAPGANADTPLRQIIERKLFNLDASIGAKMWESLKDKLAMQQHQALGGMIDQALATMKPTGTAVMVGAASPEVVAGLEQQGVPMESAGIWLRDNELIHALRDDKNLRGKTLPESFWRDIPSLLESATPYLDTQDRALIYTLDVPGGVGKIVVRVNYSEKIRDGGQRQRMTANFIRTGGIVDASDLLQSRYRKLG